MKREGIEKQVETDYCRDGEWERGDVMKEVESRMAERVKETERETERQRAIISQ